MKNDMEVFNTNGFNCNMMLVKRKAHGISELFPIFNTVNNVICIESESKVKLSRGMTEDTIDVGAMYISSPKCEECEGVNFISTLIIDRYFVTPNARPNISIIKKCFRKFLKNFEDKFDFDNESYIFYIPDGYFLDSNASIEIASAIDDVLTEESINTDNCTILVTYNYEDELSILDFGHDDYKEEKKEKKDKDKKKKKKKKKNKNKKKY